MALTLKIENHASLPDGGPLSFTLEGQRSADIGRDQHLDWSLPDPNRFISGRHCEIKYQSGDYLLVDVSTNGTFVNGASTRVQSPYRLKQGDRLQIGEYLISVAITGQPGRPSPDRDADAARPKIDRPASYDSLWDTGEEIAPPIDPRELRPQGKSTPVYGDFLSHAVDAPRLSDTAQFVPVEEAMDWAPVVKKPAPKEEAPRAPEPRRRAGSGDGAVDVPSDSPWGEPPDPPPFEAEPVSTAPPPLVAPPGQPAAGLVSGPQQREAESADALLTAFAAAAGIPLETLSHRSPEETGALLGRFALVVADEMQKLLQARVEAKRLARSSEHTLIQPQENNPLKFTPSPQDALRIMFGPPTRSYLDATRAVGAGFADLKRHQIQTYSAMQQAVRILVESLDPETLEKEAPKPQGPAALFKARKAQLWDAYVAAWQAMTKGQPEGVIGRFMFLFGSFYDRAGDR
jgi:type VI secretion system protein ImpI